MYLISGLMLRLIESLLMAGTVVAVLDISYRQNHAYFSMGDVVAIGLGFAFFAAFRSIFLGGRFCRTLSERFNRQWPDAPEKMGRRMLDLGGFVIVRFPFDRRCLVFPAIWVARLDMPMQEEFLNSAFESYLGLNCLQPN